MQFPIVSLPLPSTSAGCRDNLDAAPAHAQSLADQLDVLSILARSAASRESQLLSGSLDVFGVKSPNQNPSTSFNQFNNATIGLENI